jgi:2-methylcitrate dehydratase PrpD
MKEQDDLTGLIVRTALESSTRHLPDSALHTVKLAILDLLACCIAGSGSEGARATAAWADESSGKNDSVIIATSRRASPPLAALANGTAGHALDFDDVSVRMIHPSATLVPVLLATGEPRRLTGQEFLEGYVAGFEVQARLCRELNPEHYDRGWHTTGTIGALGAAMTACRVYQLDEEKSRWALGIAASSASGIRRNFGSMVKPFHAGQAAFHGIQAADLAERGFTGDRSVMEGKNGFLDVFSNLDRSPGLYEAFAVGAPYEIVESGIALKRFACCGAIHSAQDALLDLLEAGSFGPDEIVHIECRVNPLVPNILVHHVTQDGLEGKFSMEYSLAVCLMDGRAGLAQYTDERAADPQLVPLMERIEVVVDQSIPVNLAFFPSVVTVSLKDGRQHTARVDVPKGYPEKPLTLDEVVEKARDCCADALDAAQFEALVHSVTHLEEIPDVSVLARSLTATPVDASTIA